MQAGDEDGQTVSLAASELISIDGTPATLQPRASASTSFPQVPGTQSAEVPPVSREDGLLLKYIFKYPAPGTRGPLAAFWERAEENLQREEQVYDEIMGVALASRS